MIKRLIRKIGLVLFRRKKLRSKWLEGVHYAQRVVQDSGIESLTYQIHTNEFADSDPEFFIGVTDYHAHYTKELQEGL